MSAAPLEFLLGRLSLVPVTQVESVRSAILSADFRTTQSIARQAVLLKEQTNLSLRSVAILFNVKYSTLRDMIKATTAASSPPGAVLAQKLGPNSALLISEEQALLQWICAWQTVFDCPTIKDVRLEATRLMRVRVPDAPDLTRYWWRGFKSRHSGTIATRVVDSIESGRADVSATDVFRYFGEVLNVLSRIKSVKQVLNMDESGFSRRADKGRRRKRVYSPTVHVRPKFREENQISQLSGAVCISLAGEALLPMFITKEVVKFNNHDLNIFRNQMVCVQSRTGYQTEGTMMVWIESVLKPYCESVRSELRDQNAPFWLILDNCACHNTMAIQRKLAELGGVSVVWLPPHSTHYLQPLDATYFGAMKRHYSNGSTPQTKPKVSGKILRAYKALWMANIPTTVMAAWETTGFTYRGLGTDKVKAFLNMSLISEIVHQNCSDLEPDDSTEWDS